MVDDKVSFSEGQKIDEVLEGIKGLQVFAIHDC